MVIMQFVIVIRRIHTLHVAAYLGLPNRTNSVLFIWFINDSVKFATVRL